MTAREMLQSELQRTTMRLRAMGALEMDGERADEADVVIVTETVELDFATRDRLRARARNLRHALDKLVSGTYGQCERCEAPISPARLSAVPEARLCVECQARNERRRKRHHAGVGVFDAYARKVSEDEHACVYSRKAVE